MAKTTVKAQTCRLLHSNRPAQADIIAGASIPAATIHRPQRADGVWQKQLPVGPLIAARPRRDLLVAPVLQATIIAPSEAATTAPRPGTMAAWRLIIHASPMPARCGSPVEIRNPVT